MSWKKLGRVIEPQPRLPWMQSYAMVPTPLHLEGDLFRVYVSGRDAGNRSLIGYAVIDLAAGGKAVDYAAEAVLGLGELGCFDDNGVTPSSVVQEAGLTRLYYIGWKPRSTTRMSLVAGLALSTDGGRSFRRYSRAPILRLTDAEPFSVLTAPWVLHDSDRWRMWYVSGVEWVHADLPRYHIKHAFSRDGYVWDQAGHVAIDFKSPAELALARPCVLREPDRYRMWFSSKEGDLPYRMCYAESADGLTWERHDERAGITVSASGWDSEMVEYGCVFRHRGELYMLYNGNRYGFDGAGLAVWE